MAKSIVLHVVNRFKELRRSSENRPRNIKPYITWTNKVIHSAVSVSFFYGFPFVSRTYVNLLYITEYMCCGLNSSLVKFLPMYSKLDVLVMQLKTKWLLKKTLPKLVWTNLQYAELQKMYFLLLALSLLFVRLYIQVYN